MKRHFSPVFAAALAAAVLAGPPPSSAQLFYEPFAGEPGTVPPPGWQEAQERGAGASVELESLDFPALKAPEANKMLLVADSPDAGWTTVMSPEISGMASGTVYYSFVLQVDNLGKLTTSGGHQGIVMLSDRAAGKAVGGKAQAAVGIAADGDGGYKLSISSSHQGPQGGAVTAEKSLELQKPFLVVAAFERSGTSGAARLWIDPVPGAAEPPCTAEAPPDQQLGKNLDCIVIGCQTALLTIPKIIKIDEIRVGQTWEEVTPAR